MSSKVTNLLGRRFNRLLVIRRGPAHTDPVDRSALWVVVCDCGNERIMSARKLRETKTCGLKTCTVSRRLRAEKIPDLSTSPLADEIKEILRKRDEKRKELELNEEKIQLLTMSPCYYCQEQPSEMRGRCGVDKLDQGKGYIESNVVPVCQPCRMIRGQLGYKQWIAQIRRIALVHTDLVVKGSR